MARNFGHEDAGLATVESLGTIVKNFNIRTFLESNQKRYLVGPKGSGKTLLLLKKALDHRQQGGGIYIPSEEDLPVDRLTAAEHVGKKFNYSFSDPTEASLAWASIWKHSIFRSVLHHLRDTLEGSLDRKGASAGAEEMVANASWVANSADQILESALAGAPLTPQRPFHFYTEIGDKLDSAPSRTLRALREETRRLESLLHAFRPPVYVFLDNLDDYYERAPNLWFNSMYGQFRAVREISLAHRNVHLFTSIRRDVYEQFDDEMRLQYYDYVAHLEYTKEELLDIFSAHLTMLDDDLLAVPAMRESNPWVAFFGDCQRIPHEFVGIEEDVRDYLHRHTLGRPRDMVHLGTVLLARRPAAGFRVESIREAVRKAEREVAAQYLAEIRPLLDPRFNIKEFISNHVAGNVLDRTEMERIQAAYLAGRDGGFDRDAPSDMTRPFATLYELGLLGVANRRAASRAVQDFHPIGQGLSHPNTRTLPESDLYFLHPILSDLLPRRSGSARMVVGSGLPVP